MDAAKTIKPNKTKMNAKKALDSLKHNHFLMMILCCALPLLLLLGAVYFFGLSKSYLYWFMLLLCPLMHFFMMKDMHGRSKSKEKSEKSKNGEKCHR